MRPRAVATALLALAAGGCASERLQAVAPFAGPGGINVAPVEIDSSPTTAWIYIDGRYAGNTPLVHELTYKGDTRLIEVVAEPLPDHPMQTRQTKHIPVPPLPARLHFFMNNQDKPAEDG